jgi:hypothetical protein
MMEQRSWQEGNAHYLSNALAWLRLRLEQYIQRIQAPAVDVSVEPFDPDATSIIPMLGRVPKEQTRPSQNELAQRAAEMLAAESQLQPPPALVAAGRRLGLSRFERDTLLLCIAMELDTRIASLCARAQDDPLRAYPTFALALTLFDEPSWDVLSPERPLRHWRLLEINQPGAQPLTTSPLRADERIVNYVKGLNYLDDRLASFIVPLDVEESKPIELPPSQAEVVEQMKLYWRQALRQATATSLLPIVQLVGPDVASKQLVALHVASDLRRPMYRLPVEMLPGQSADLELLARLWQRESRLQPLALYIDAQEMDGSSPNEGLSLSRFLGRCDGPFFFLGTRESWSRLGRANLTLDVGRPTAAEQQTAWKAALNGVAPESPALLASQFNLNLPTIQRIAQTALDRSSANSQSAIADQLWDTCRLSARPHLDTLAQRLDPKATWDELVLPDEEINMLHQLADQVGQRGKVYEEWGFAARMNRGLGINALFAGESGTGKTMAAEVVANALRLNLYRIDLSAVVSKFIGETEKNLRRLFDAAEDGGTILFFDEADALFGKRSEVKDSHDRYANIEINYLLQRMEAYRGLAILATNMRSALDVAFTRRLRFIINFPFPSPSERKRMWQKAFATKTPIIDEGLDYDRLARFNLTGGSIHTVALNAAFLAAQADTKVSMPLILAAARAEFRKLDRHINEAEFRWQPTSITQGGTKV